MSSEVELNSFHPKLGDLLSIDGRGDLPSFDRVLYTSRDLPESSTLPELIDPAANFFGGELEQRRAEVDAKHRRVIEFLDQHGYDAVVFSRGDSIAWFTNGGDLGQDLGSDSGAVSLIVNRATRAVLTDNVQSPRVFEEELAGLGFQLKERPWYQDPARVVAELACQRRTATDEHRPGLEFEGDRLRALRCPLSPIERRSLRSLGRTLALAVEATCRNIESGETEAEVAGQLAHRLIREGVTPVDLRVAGDDRLARYRQPRPKAATIDRRATITATGRRHGLCASISRTVAFGMVDDQFRSNHTLAAMVNATCIYFSRPGEPIGEVFRRARRIYEKFDHPHEWTLADQGSIVGYTPREKLLLPDSPEPLEAGTAIAWSPSVGAARSEDTVLIDHRGFEVVTETRDWPLVEIIVKGYTMTRPGILER